eukprot:TRINITY_DN2809_c1_g1_i1.p1 TRINITY_DN2809_c1_g1~~TRINITY_DN2809_c1_g1_i1.p1  ORF type:complete len:568 (+),score=171.70 TRINITY_DN2809_c1_g1_i1:198-1706(+)
MPTAMPTAQPSAEPTGAVAPPSALPKPAPSSPPRGQRAGRGRASRSRSSTLAPFGSKIGLGLDAEQLKKLEGCCIGDGCDVRQHFDSWCYDRDAACPEFKSGWACGAAKCAPRWRGAVGGVQGSMPFTTVARCAAALLNLTGTNWRLPPLPPDGWGPDFTEADFPLSVVATRHMCWRPCNNVWLCHGKFTASSYVHEYCWRHFYRIGKHHKIRRWKSLMAVWTPPVTDQISSLLTQLGTYDPKLHALIRRALDHYPTGTAVDVGANLGVVSMYAAHQGHRVVSFDATPWTRHKLALSAWLNNFTDRIRIVPAAVGAEEGVANLAVVPGNLGGNQLVRDDEHNLVAANRSLGGAGLPGQKGTVEVPITTLDVALENEKDVFFIKVDIEGHEIQALQGASKTLKKHKPTLIVETCFWCRPTVLFTFLQEHQYVCGRDETIIERTNHAKRGQWKWDVELVLRPEARHQLRPNVLCIWDPVASAQPFDPNPAAPYDKKWDPYRVDT